MNYTTIQNILSELCFSFQVLDTTSDSSQHALISVLSPLHGAMIVVIVLFIALSLLTEGPGVRLTDADKARKPGSL